MLTWASSNPTNARPSRGLLIARDPEAQVVYAGVLDDPLAEYQQANWKTYDKDLLYYGPPRVESPYEVTEGVRLIAPRDREIVYKYQQRKNLNDPTQSIADERELLHHVRVSSILNGLPRPDANDTGYTDAELKNCGGWMTHLRFFENVRPYGVSNSKAGEVGKKLLNPVTGGTIDVVNNGPDVIYAGDWVMAWPVDISHMATPAYRAGGHGGRAVLVYRPYRPERLFLADVNQAACENVARVRQDQLRAEGKLGSDATLVDLLSPDVYYTIAYGGMLSLAEDTLKENRDKLVDFTDDGPHNVAYYRTFLEGGLNDLLTWNDAKKEWEIEWAKYNQFIRNHSDNVLIEKDANTGKYTYPMLTRIGFPAIFHIARTNNSDPSFSDPQKLTLAVYYLRESLFNFNKRTNNGTIDGIDQNTNMIEIELFSDADVDAAKIGPVDMTIIDPSRHVLNVLKTHIENNVVPGDRNNWWDVVKARRKVQVNVDLIYQRSRAFLKLPYNLDAIDVIARVRQLYNSDENILDLSREIFSALGIVATDMTLKVRVIQQVVGHLILARARTTARPGEGLTLRMCRYPI